jgi:hypothetical protein
MEKIIVNISQETVTVFNENRQNWETCNFEEAGLLGITDQDEITEYFREKNDDEDVEVTFS